MNSENKLIELKSLQRIYRYNKESQIKYWFWGIMLLAILFAFLPWTQNVKSKGNITTLSQEFRPQNVNSPISGRIIKWWVKEGDFVKVGDTILQLAEIKEEYLDPNLINRTKEQLNAKKGSADFYSQKIGASGNQIQALNSGLKLKIEQLNNKLIQLENKLKGENAELKAVNNEFKIAQEQYDRQQKMFQEGLVSQTQLEQRNVSFQNALSKKIIVENKIAITQQEISNTRIEQNAVQQDYTEKISKAQAEQFQSQSQIQSINSEMAKLQNQVSNYIIRNGMYFIIATQNGQIAQANKSGIGEILKDGETISLIVPNRMDYAVEMFVRPMDLPLMSKGQNVRFMFDGFPAIIFSGWPNSSYGTFSGKIIAIENTISNNGMFRILVTEDNSVKKWPQGLRLGAGAKCITLLKDVPIWYEVWRNINGFPPDFYHAEEEKNNIKKEKK
jgi:multidrug resistance efflux pump